MNGFLKSVLHRINKKYRNYKDLFETIKKKAKRMYYSILLNVLKIFKKHGML